MELVHYADGEVDFKMRDGREFSYRITDLSAASRKMIETWAKEANKVRLSPDHRLKVTVHTSRAKTDTDGGYTGWKDLDERIDPKVIISNDEYTHDFKKLKATIALIGEDVTDRRKLKVVFKDDFEFGVAHRSSYEWSGTPFTLDYLLDDNDGHDNSHGYRYRYYFVVIKNEDGSVGHSSSNVSVWERNPQLVEKLELNQICDRELR